MSEVYNLPNEQEQLDFYNKLRAKLVRFLESKKGKHNKFTKYLLFAPDLFHLLVKSMMDESVDPKSKALIGGGVAYFMLPVDFMPEALIGFGGFLDDIVIATVIINTLINKLGPEVLEKYWSGDEQLLNVLQKVSEMSDHIVSKFPVKSVFANIMARENKFK